MASEASRVLYRRLWAVSFWPLLAIAVAVPVQQAAIQLHDRAVVARDLACLAAAGPAASASCNIEVGPDGAPRSTRAWRAELASGAAGPRAAESLDHALDLAAVAIAPVAALVLARRWTRWSSAKPSR